MRKLIGTTVMALVMTAPAFATPVVAPPKPIIPVFGCTSAYVVEYGDTLWDLAELKLNNPALWSWLVEQNPVLQEPDRYYVKNGKEIVEIYPGEKLYCLEDVGINRPSTQLITTLQGDIDEFSPPVAEKTFIDYLWDWWLLLALAVLGLIAWLIYRESRKDPVNSGPPQISGGVNTFAQAAIRFGARARENDFTVLNVTPGTIYGVMNVSYGDGTERPRSLNGERAYQATVRRENGQVENIYMLQACGNDLRFGGIARYIPGPDFRFVPDTAEAAPAETSSTSSTETSSSTPTKPELKIELKPGEREGETSMVRVTGAPTESMVITVTDDSFTMRFHPPKKD